MSKLSHFGQVSNSLPEEVFRSFGKAIIWQAIEGKYPGVNISDIDEFLRYGQLKSEEKALASHDIARQWKCLVEIELRFRFLQNFDVDLLDIMYCILYGTHSAVRRTETLVLQDDSTGTVDPSKIAMELESFEPMLRQVIEVQTIVDLPTKLGLAAKIFAELIRIHPYPDGNGRVSRMAINLCMRMWSLPYIAIPKVRNNELWQESLRAAIMGDPRFAADFFGTLINDSLEMIQEMLPDAHCLE